MDTQALLDLATRIVTLRQQLATAEAQWEAATGKPRRGRRPKLAQPGVTKVPTAERVRNFLKDAREPVTFSQITSAIGDVPREAIKSALKKAREHGLVGFKGLKYFWK